jgi:hypothetical protein
MNEPMMSVTEVRRELATPASEPDRWQPGA